VIIEAAGCVVTPGIVNTHHHLNQTLTRALPGATEASQFGWLKRLYPVWATYTPDDVFAATQLGLAELALSGCSLSSDHLCLFPNGVTLDDTIHAAEGIGLRFHATHGLVSAEQSAKGLPPDSLVEQEDAILADCIRVIDRFHDASDGAVVRVGVAPCSPFSVSRDLMREAALLARDKRVMLHTHLAETADDVAFSLERFGCRPGQYAEGLGWTGPDVWHAHCMQRVSDEIDLFARTKTGVAHCPGSNCRLASGIAPLRRMVDAGVPMVLGVDGSASNDTANLLGEARTAMLSAVDWNQRNMLVFGVSLSLALGLQLEPDVVAHLPETARILMTSGALPAAVMAIVLDLVLPRETADEELGHFPVSAE